MKESYNVIGLMSGTALDGLDLAYCRFGIKDQTWKFDILITESIDYTDQWRSALLKGFDLPAAKLDDLDKEYGRWLGARTLEFIRNNNLDVDLIASHGHTIFHEPEKGIILQIGSGQEIANITGKKVICDFRKLDVSLGGQGAPLVPIGDEYLFGQYIACVNLGGIANISFKDNGQRVAYDIGMANMLLNYIASQIDLRFDESGELARRGKVDKLLLEKLNNLEYYKLPYPKSTGYEWFLSDVKPLIDKSSASVKDKLATSVEHEAQQLGNVLTQNLAGPGQVLITGGGALNPYLIERIKNYTSDNFQVVVPDAKIIEFKEALIFAFMGVLLLRNEINCLKSVTGASRDSSCGEVFEPLI